MSFFEPERPSCCPTTSPSSSFMYSSTSSSSSSHEVSARGKIFQAVIFSVPILFTFILLFLFFLCYLRRRRVDWASLRMRTSTQDSNDVLRKAELGVEKEVREMLPVIVYKESFSIRDTLCPVCLGDYQAEDRLQQMPSCGHTYHKDCIGNWLANHTTCPLCRLSLLPSAKVHNESPDDLMESGRRNSGETFVEPEPQAVENSAGT